MKNSILLILILTSNYIFAQNNKVANPKFDDKISSLLEYSVPVISVTDLKEMKAKDNNLVILDSRELKEYNVSHIPGAIAVGYDKFILKELPAFDSDQRIVVYCSIGYRSEKIGEKLQNAGFTNVYNLYGSIFEWVNQGNDVIDKDGVETDEIHTYNGSWSKWVTNPLIKKVY